MYKIWGVDMKWYQLDLTEVEKATNSDAARGLSEKEAQRRLKKFGENKLAEEEKPNAFFVFLSQFKDFMVLVLLVATLISGLLGEYIDAITIIVIVFLNGILGFVQERKAEKSLTALKELSSPQMLVLRDGEWKKIPSSEAVVGDVVKIASGDRIGADIRLIEVHGLQVEESSLTGESVPVQKHARPLSIHYDIEVGDQDNMVFMGTLVTQGSGVGIVVATGMNTEMGKIAHLLKTTESQTTPLQKRLEQLGKILIIVALALTALVVVFGIYQGHDVYNMFLAGVSLAVAAIPEGLPAIVTVVLALGVQRMIKRKAIVRKLPAVETLGCATVICSDKTGTLTQNKMTVTHLWAGGKTWTVTGDGYEPYGDFYYEGNKINIAEEKILRELLAYGVLCNNAKLNKKAAKEWRLKRKGETYAATGDPTEIALLVCAKKANITEELLSRQFKKVKEFPFDSTRKMMTVIVEDAAGQRFAITKGAPDVLLDLSSEILYNDRPKTMTNDDKAMVERAVELLAKQALRTIAIAIRPLKKSSPINVASHVEKDFIFVGLQGMIDPPRKEVKRAIKECHEAGIKTVMITGDHKITAEAIAKQLDILPEGGKVLDGQTLSRMSDEEFKEMVDDVYVYARVTPEHKLKIVQALQAKGHVVAMTGDGVNDAPAIKAANIGIAMGMTGTDVAKEASSLILSDDNFATIKEAIKEGRNIYENIRKFIRYILASNVGEILVMLFAMILGLPLPLVAIQILWINLVTDGLPAMALGLDQPDSDVMKRSPRNPNEGIFARGLAWKILSRGFMIGLVTILAFMMTLRENPDNLTLAQTVAFATLVMAQLIHVFDCRSEYSVFHRNPFENVYLVLAVLSSVLLMLAVIYYPPLQTVFHTTYLNAREWALILVMSSIPTVALGTFQVFKKS